MADRRPHPKAPPVITRDGVLRAPPAPWSRLEAFVGDRLWPGRIALGHLATGLLDLTLRLLDLAFPFHLLVAAQFAAGIFDLAFDLVTQFAHGGPPVFSAIRRLLKNIMVRQCC